jgi:hypothetical protein
MQHAQQRAPSGGNESSTTQGRSSIREQSIVQGKWDDHFLGELRQYGDLNKPLPVAYGDLESSANITSLTV